MEDENLPSSQGSVFTFSDTIGDENVNSSPIHPSRAHSSKLKARPTVTPRTFTRFFTPRSFSTRSGKFGASRQALKDITASASNRKSDIRFRTVQKDTISVFEDTAAAPAKKKRKTQDFPLPNVVGSSPLKRVSAPASELTPNETEDESDWAGNEDGVDSPQETASKQLVQRTKPIVRSKQKSR